jgi:hypothetical protein
LFTFDYWSRSISSTEHTTYASSHIPIHKTFEKHKITRLRVVCIVTFYFIETLVLRQAPSQPAFKQITVQRRKHKYCTMYIYSSIQAGSCSSSKGSHTPAGEFPLSHLAKKCRRMLRNPRIQRELNDYRGPGFIIIVRFGSYPNPSPVSKCLSFSAFLCVAGRTYRRRGGKGTKEKTWSSTNHSILSAQIPLNISQL